MKYSNFIKIGSRIISEDHPTYFIADIGANHDGNLKRAKNLIKLSAEAGADAAKFQHFKAETIVSDEGFKNLNSEYLSHQSSWKKSVFEVYKDASINLEWDYELKSTCEEFGIEYLTSPYDLELVDHVDEFVRAYKIGSGDITWIENIKKIASKGKPVILACGASNYNEIVRAVEVILNSNSQLSILQCNTNYTGNINNLDYINLNVLKTLKNTYPKIVVGLSDHTPGHATAVGAVALGGRIIEKHFTDDNSRIGPDHGFAMNPKTWKQMVVVVRELERALGNGIKKVEENEKNTVIIQRRSLRAKKKFFVGDKLLSKDVSCLRPCPTDALEPWQLEDYIGRELKRNVDKGEYLKASDFE
jgi:N-acetylneuraminate synthase